MIIVFCSKMYKNRDKLDNDVNSDRLESRFRFHHYYYHYYNNTMLVLRYSKYPKYTFEPLCALVNSTNECVPTSK